MHEYKVRVRLSETDCLGIAYYSNYFVYFDVARIELLRDAGITKNDMDKRGLTFVCAEASCKYLASLEFDEIITVKTWIEKIGNSSIVYRHLILKENGVEAAQGYVRDVLVDKNRKLVTIPEEWRNSLIKYLKI
jgi:acyl-CoA thioester hydrolase